VDKIDIPTEGTLYKVQDGSSFVYVMVSFNKPVSVSAK
jgi:hypothetical protein